ncbi:unnamed protein product [Auanema sp. JU1783]|nr:unnamed protein product [Auanema sp. JU1783]
MNLTQCILFFLFYSIHVLTQRTPVQVCDTTNSNNSFIYCYGRLLEAVNQHQLFNDSKTFVDMPMVLNPDETQRLFDDRFGTTPVENINKTDLKAFVNKYFLPAGSELLNCTPPDWKATPSILMKINDPDLRAWASELNNIWRTLCKKIDPQIEEHSSRYSLIYVPNLFIVPGGRFRESYYWDAYWIIKGLLICEMHETAKSMIENFATLVERYGFIPNGGRVYYLQRSQPPLLSGMVYEYFETTNDYEFIRKMIPVLEKEMSFWNNNRMVNITRNGFTYSVYQYRTASNVPRPESYHEDTTKSKNLLDPEQFYTDVASAAESGMDFSTRWFADKASIYHIETTKVVPIDLNAFMCWNFDILEYLSEKINDFDTAEKYRNMRAEFRQVVDSIFYNETAGTWYDYNLRTNMHNTEFYPTMTVPLFTGCYNTLDQGKSERLYKLMKNMGVFDYQSGIPTSMIQGSNEQWDFPNGWSPLNHMVIEGLRKSQNPQMQDQGFLLARKWVLGNYNVWRETKHMYEKYNVIGTYPKPGSGGEYDVQDGFGWTNGVVLDLLSTYADRLHVDSDTSSTEANIIHRTTRSVKKHDGKSAHQSTLSFLALFLLFLSLF